MNWTEIEKKYPEPFKKCLKYFEHPDNRIKEFKVIGQDILITTEDGSSGLYYFRDLYDFFDDQEIFLRPTFRDTHDETKLQWGYYYKLGVNLPITHKSQKKRWTEAKDRSELEEIMFIAGFIILNNQINHEKRNQTKRIN